MTIRTENYRRMSILYEDHILHLNLPIKTRLVEKRHWLSLGHHHCSHKRQSKITSRSPYKQKRKFKSRKIFKFFQLIRGTISRLHFPFASLRIFITSSVRFVTTAAPGRREVELHLNNGREGGRCSEQKPHNSNRLHSEEVKTLYFKTFSITFETLVWRKCEEPFILPQ